MKGIHSASKAILPCMIGMGIAGCIPMYMTVQPQAELTIKDSSGKGVERAFVNIGTGTYRNRRPPSLTYFVTDRDGETVIPRKKRWHLEWLMMHMGTHYSWSVCVEKDGYVPHMTYLSHSSESLRITLVETEAPMRCLWPSQYDASFDLIRLAR
ncbi:MAG: hypothetical protein OXQ29_05870 [Rhodospirillaceae bacterium]|nr:hypothetical protein [Rhodospirillaceae bacterium]